MRSTSGGSAALLNRVAALESRAALRMALQQESQEEPWDEHRTASCVQMLRLLPLGYSGSWRFDTLSLEQLLALARDDSVREDADKMASAANAREFEIQILERDAKINAETARSLRKNLHAHFFGHDGYTAVGTETLGKLPHPVEFDESAALKVARSRVPHFASLSLEERLECMQEDLRGEAQRAAQSRLHANAVALRAPRSKEWVNAEAVARLHELRPIGVEHKIKELQEKIAERNRKNWDHAAVT
jgi:hypothetical protein